MHGARLISHLLHESPQMRRPLVRGAVQDLAHRSGQPRIAQRTSENADEPITASSRLIFSCGSVHRFGRCIAFCSFLIDGFVRYGGRSCER